MKADGQDPTKGRLLPTRREDAKQKSRVAVTPEMDPLSPSISLWLAHATSDSLYATETCQCSTSWTRSLKCCSQSAHTRMAVTTMPYPSCHRPLCRTNRRHLSEYLQRLFSNTSMTPVRLIGIHALASYFLFTTPRRFHLPASMYRRSRLRQRVSELNNTA
ncbi:hypothetical protein OE88DRAFT_108749 [Heliocybe sulcata]|uniref:Uncharacterized protein n=1 Tax=Heliocybe sulcata TaxID=5364 RepID=A0A5C3NK05_9AGAM|nr:hypothetical protein OE88DRAFT_108749 [Heliocybe sulcata]